MARQKNIYIRGTFGNLTFYERLGTPCIRTKSTLSSKRVKTSPEFKQTMINAGCLATASRIASGLYRTINQSSRKRDMYQLLVSDAIKMLKAGRSEEEVYLYLKENLRSRLSLSEKEMDEGI